MANPLTSAVLQEVSRLPWLTTSLGLPGADLAEVYVEVQVQDAARGALGADRDALGPALLYDAYRWAPSRWLLLGAAGAGKSTLLRKLAQQLEAAEQVPLWLHADDLVGVTSVAGAAEARYALGDQADAARRASTLVVLVDGLDEAVDPEGTRKGLKRVIDTAGGCPVVVAAREIDPMVLPAFGRLLVRPLTAVQARTLLRRLEVPEAVYDHLVRRARGWADNPTLLTLAAAVVRADGMEALPAGRAALYERAVEVILGHEYESGQPGALSEAARIGLEDAVLALHGSEGFTLDRLRACLTDRGHPDCTPALLKCGLIHAPPARRRGPLRPVEPLLEFPHRTLAEWIGAAAVPRVDVEALLDKAVAAPARWGELLALAVSRECARDRGAGIALFDRINARKVPALSFRVVAEAEGLPAESLLAVLGVDGARSAWEERSKVLQRLPELVGDRVVAVEVYLRFAATTRHGADLWWVRWGLGQIAAGDDEAADLARAALPRVWDHIPAEDRERALALMKPWWRTIPAGEGWMGSPGSEAGRYLWEGPRRKVRVVEPFEMLGVPVTQGMYRLFDPAHISDDDDFGGRVVVPNPQELPVYRVSWYEAESFATWLNLALPTEAVWEYACRGGTETPYWSGTTENDLAAVGWYCGNSKHPRPVGVPPTARSHPFGLYDLHGNVYEWCRDAWNDSHFERPEVVMDDEDPVDGAPAAHVLRGGAFSDAAQSARSAFRNGAQSWRRLPYLGFRLVRPPRPAR